MPNGVRNSIWAVFFLAGMAFTATLVFMLRPDVFTSSGVREKPGSTVLLGAATAPELEPEPPPAITTTEVGAPKEPELPAVAKNKQPPSPPRVEQPKIQTRQQVQETALETTTAADLEFPKTKPSTTFRDDLISTVRHVRPGKSVFGHVSLIGELPPAKTMPVADGFCGPHSSATSIVFRVFLRARDNSLADVLVFLRGRDLEKRHWPEPPQTAVVAQRGCQFEPYITAIQLGQTVTFENLDPVLHNVHARPTESRNREWNVAQMPKGRPVVLEFKQPENFIRVECSVHSYMVAYICVMPHPFFALTKEDGRFVIPNVPPGEYTVEASHRKAGVIKQKIIVKEDESPDLEFTFPRPAETLSLGD